MTSASLLRTALELIERLQLPNRIPIKVTLSPCHRIGPKSEILFHDVDELDVLEKIVGRFDDEPRNVLEVNGEFVVDGFAEGIRLSAFIKPELLSEARRQRLVRMS